MSDTSYTSRRGDLQTYFDRTAADAWKALTSDAPVSRIRATVRAGRAEMFDTLLSWLPQTMAGLRVLDAGCGTGTLAIALARRGAQVLATDVSPTLVSLAKERNRHAVERGVVNFAVGDMLDPHHGEFDYVVAMDSLIHYDGVDIAKALATLAERTKRSILFTLAPRTPALSIMHTIGKLFPQKDRSPAIIPITRHTLESNMEAHPQLRNWRISQTAIISRGFYKSMAMELVLK